MDAKKYDRVCSVHFLDIYHADIETPIHCLLYWTHLVTWPSFEVTKLRAGVYISYSLCRPGSDELTIDY